MRKWAGGVVGLLLWFSLGVATAQDEPAITIHVVQRGENLYQIALRYGVSLDTLAQANGITHADSVQVGQRLLVPVGDGDAALNTHTVQPGETLRSIAALYNLAPEAVAEANGLPGADVLLYVGQVLQLGLTDAAAPPGNPNDTAADGDVLIHTVRAGETLYQIAVRYGVEMNDLAATNSITDPSLIFSGQTLAVPGVSIPDVALDVPAVVTQVSVAPLVFTEGQTGALRLSTGAPATLSGTFLGQTLQFAASADGLQHVALMGVPMFTEGGVHTMSLTVAPADGGEPATFDANILVLVGAYGRERIDLLDDRGNLLDADVEDAEMQILRGVMTAFTPQRAYDGPMSLPAAAPVVSPYGTRRSYNGGDFDRFHAGTDFAGAPGTPILAAAPGRVVLVDTLNVRGLAVVIDHGWGVYTGYWHQSQTYVSVGEQVATGQTIGTIGATGRVTGAHLHWELWVNGVAVDPMQWVQESFTGDIEGV